MPSSTDPKPIDPTSVMNKLTEYAKQPQYIMMFLGLIFTLGIAFIMYLSLIHI